ncbi:diguanylate cyclase (GGDEF)-like protein/PAS domain S-box-containing protein [Paucibacter oligotrophus]|uniref:Diguanylate cyclase (GGDEF)-like protein/PAS domain S-box-containing protein n=1 Tax=Roseateles oligotrophus TaxID=1769250 RepID=A0A840L5U7_9BURK|nr:GGDEF domain-containing phosphodiesterase [Roseateles oligotrophus]MBB4842052.1 diguanylate cyclase (GGDEF)-like protein/PAS domain S-box-containing protein [Roseateles oligotrophus]
MDNIASAPANTPQPLRRPWLLEFAQTPLLALAYLLCAWPFLSSPAAATAPALIWPPAALALLAFFWRGKRALPGLLLGIAGLLLVQEPNNPQGPSWIWGVQKMLELVGPAAAALWLRRWDFHPTLTRRRDLLLFCAAALLLGPALSGLLPLLLGPMDHSPGLAWALGSASHAFSVLSLAPAWLALLELWQGKTPGQQGLAQTHWAELPLQLLLSLALLASATPFFASQNGAASSRAAWIFLPHGLLAAMSLGRGRALPTLAALAFNALVLLASAQGLGPLGAGTDGPSAALIWGYLASLAAIPLLAGTLKAQLHERQQDWQRVLANADLAQAEWRLGPQGASLVSASALWLRELGPLSAASAPIGHWLAAAHPLDRERVRQALESLLPAVGKESCRETVRLLGKNGEWRHFELRALVQERSFHAGRPGRALYLQCTLADISWRHTAEERQRMSISLFQHIHEGLMLTDLDNQVLDVNPSYCEMLGAPREALIGQAATPLSAATLRRSGLDPAQMLAALASQGFWQCRVHTERADGSPCQLQLTVSTVPEPDGPLRYRVVTVTDLTTTLLQQELLERQSRFDALTHLPNQEEFMRRLHAGLQQAEREGFRLSICRVDLDQFKRINSQRGSDVADALLQQVGLRLKNALRSAPQWADTVARLSGDEFALLLRGSSQEETQLALERLLKLLSLPYRLESATAGAEAQVLSITASIGATVYPQDNSDAETLMRHAGHALYRVKHSGRNAFQLFDTAKRLRDEASLIALARVQQALDANELQLFYQPKIDMHSGEVLGMEALLRWQHPERGLLSPLHFLPLIESTGLAVQVGDWVIEQALKQCAQWLLDGLPLQVSVNVTARQLQMPDFSQRLLELIRRHPEPVASHLCLEVLESAALADVDATHALIQRCRSFGVSFALDDFGTGYSTLTYLKRLPVDALKIDRSFVQNMLLDPQDSALVEGVIGLARNFGCSVVAEGVESAAHAQALLAMGCQLGQGNGIAPAMPATDVPDWVQGFAQAGWRTRIGGGAAGVP